MARTKGSKNKHTFQVEEIAQKFDCEPFEILMRIATGDWKWFGFQSESKTAYSPQGIEMDELNIPFKERVSAAKEASRYLYSQKQSVAISTGDTGIKIIVEDYSKAK